MSSIPFYWGYFKYFQDRAVHGQVQISKKEEHIRVILKSVIGSKQADKNGMVGPRN